MYKRSARLASVTAVATKTREIDPITVHVKTFENERMSPGSMKKENHPDALSRLIKRKEMERDKKKVPVMVIKDVFKSRSEKTTPENGNEVSRPEVDVALLGKLFPEKYTPNASAPEIIYPTPTKRFKSERSSSPPDQDNALVGLELMQKIAEEILGPSSSTEPSPPAGEQPTTEFVNARPVEITTTKKARSPSPTPFIASSASLPMSTGPVRPFPAPIFNMSTNSFNYRTNVEMNEGLSEQPQSRLMETSSIEARHRNDVMDLEKKALEAQIRRDLSIAVYHERLAELMETDPFQLALTQAALKHIQQAVDSTIRQDVNHIINSHN